MTPLRSIPLDDPDSDDPLVVSVSQYPGKAPHMRLSAVVRVGSGNEGDNPWEEPVIVIEVEHVADFDLDRAAVEQLRDACEEFLR
ncbi:MAG: hypothetical protein NVS3B1_12660 [Marmoricola sp.]